MRVFEQVAPLKSYLRELQRRGLRIGFVPTMGALHEGHLSLVDEAKRRAEVVVASVFVNPKQFGPNEDLARYPRDLVGDQAQLASRGCGVLFTPTTDEMYPEGFQTEVKVTKATRGLCGDHRPGHFDGVTTVVLRLFAIVRPDVSVFGEKDYQQLTVIRTMTRDLGLDVEIVGVPTVREADGLAMSSRNAYLSRDDRVRALALSRGLQGARRAYEAGERAGETLLGTVRAELDAAGIAPEYLELRRADDLAPLDRADDGGVILVAARVGSTRLIDNLILRRA